MKEFLQVENIKIGTQYIKTGRKNKQIETVIDIYKTYNFAGELVHTRYVSEHEFCGQSLKNYNVVASTIQRGAI